MTSRNFIDRTNSDVMFYARDFTPALRFGDVVRGFVIASSDVKAPFLTSAPDKYALEVNQPQFAVVLSPCCSISDRVLSLAPLVRLRATFFSNPYLAEDVTRINIKMTAEQAVPPAKWANLPVEEKIRRQAEPLGYAFNELFVYQAHQLLSNYTIPRREGDVTTNMYMIDFRSASKVNCEKVINAKQSPVEAKCLELSIETRSQLREKIAEYFARIPREDSAAAV